MSPVFSLENPPNAPKKKTPMKVDRWRLDRIPVLSFPDDEEKVEEEWELLRHMGGIREKYLVYSPPDIASIRDGDFLSFLWEAYAFPASQPRNPCEEAYLSLMRDAIEVQKLNL